MNQPLKSARLAKGWTQPQAASRLGVSQAYLSMLEAGQRSMSQRLARKAAAVFGQPALMPLPVKLAVEGFDPQEFAQTLAGLGYQGFAYLKPSASKTNPAAALMAALSQDDLEARLVEALPWLLLKFWNVDSDWLVLQAKLHDLQNRLGFVTTLARSLSERSTEESPARTAQLRNLEQTLDRGKLAHEGTLCRVLGPNEIAWLRENRPPEARNWNLLTDLNVEHLNHAK